eukprot:9470260-Pyramimonas_sp.AAC.1
MFVAHGAVNVVVVRARSHRLGHTSAHAADEPAWRGTTHSQAGDDAFAGGGGEFTHRDGEFTGIGGEFTDRGGEFTGRGGAGTTHSQVDGGKFTGRGGEFTDKGGEFIGFRVLGIGDSPVLAASISDVASLGFLGFKSLGLQVLRPTYPTVPEGSYPLNPTLLSPVRRL